METLTYSLEERGNTPIYEYLYLCIRRDIISGRLKGGEKLPSKRTLSSNFGISIITVENAYAQLLTEGYIKSIEKKGYYVEAFEFRPDNIHDRNTAIRGTAAGIIDTRRTDVRGTDAGNCCVGSLEKKSNNTTGGGENRCIDFTANSAPEDSFPFDSWARIMRRVLLDRESNFTSAPPREGEPELRKAIADYLYESRGMSVSPDRIIIGPGTEYLHHILIELIGRNNFFATEDPGYKKVGKIYEADGVKVIYIPVDENGMEVEKLDGSNIRLVHTSPAHHFPLGCVMSAPRRNRLLDWAQSQNAYVIEDDYDSEFRFEGCPIATLYSMNPERVIYMNTFTKTLAASIRIAYMILPEELYARFENRLSFISGSVSSFEQMALAAFISGGYYGRHIRRMRAKYRKYRENLLEAIKASGLDKKVKICDSKAGLHLILKLPMYVDDKNLINSLEELNIKIQSIAVYCYKTADSYRDSLMLCYNDTDKEMLISVMRNISEILKAEPSHKNRKT